jgi:hypothetical protein
MEPFCFTFTTISCCVSLLVKSTYHATTENHVWTTALEQHIRQLDLAHMLGGGNLLGEANEQGTVCVTKA